MPMGSFLRGRVVSGRFIAAIVAVMGLSAQPLVLEQPRVALQLVDLKRNFPILDKAGGFG